jgi:hypothetical protein
MVKVLAAFTVNGVVVMAVAPELETVMAPVIAPGGITTLTDDVVMLCSGIEMEPPFRLGMVTCGAEPKLLPLMITMVPTGPAWGAKLVMIGVALATAKPAGRLGLPFTHKY